MIRIFIAPTDEQNSLSDQLVKLFIPTCMLSAYLSELSQLEIAILANLATIIAPWKEDSWHRNFPMHDRQ